MAKQPPSIKFTLEDLPKKQERVISVKEETKVSLTPLVMPEIISSPTLNAVGGTSYFYSAVATGTTPILWSLFPVDSPVGIDIDSGMLSWDSPLAGEYAITIRASNEKGFVEQSYTLGVDPAPAGFQGGDTGLIFCGYGSISRKDIIEDFTISTGASAVSFGASLQATDDGAAVSNGFSGDRVLHAGGYDGSEWIRAVEWVSASTRENARLFGGLQQLSTPSGTVDNASNDRGIFGAGMTHEPAMYSGIEYVTISAGGSGNMATSFGNLLGYRRHAGGTSNGRNDRGIYAGGGSPISLDSIEYITISIAGDAVDFGTMATIENLAACSNSVNERALLIGGSVSSVITNNIDFITISTAGDAVLFGEMTSGRKGLAATSNGENDRAVVSGGAEDGAVAIDTMSYMTISSGAAAVDFGNLGEPRRGAVGASNGM